MSIKDDKDMIEEQNELESTQTENTSKELFENEEEYLEEETEGEKEENVSYSSPNKEKKSLSDKRAKNLRMFSLGSVVIALAFIIVVNLILDSAVGKKLSWDLTSTQLRSISDTSKDFLSTLEDDVEIVGLFDYDKYYSSANFIDFVTLLDDFKANSGGKISVRYVDPQLVPSIISELDPNNAFNISSANAGDFVVKSGNKLRIVSRSSCYNYDQTTGERTSNSIEANFSGAIMSVTSDVDNKAYFVTNHYEASSVQIKQLLYNKNIEPADIDLMSVETIPEDCRLLILNDPKQDISEKEEKLLREYLFENGGNLMVVSGFSPTIVATFDRLNNILHEMNLHLSDGLILESNPGYIISADDYFSYMDIVNGFGTSGYGAMVYFTKPVMEHNNPKNYIQTVPIISTSSSAYVLEKGDKEAQSAVAARYNGAMLSYHWGNLVECKVAVFGSVLVADDAFITQFSTNHENPQLFVNVAMSMLGDEVGVGIQQQIRAKTYPSSVLVNPPAANSVNAMAIVFIGVLPGLLLVAAIVVYNKRKKL